MSREQRIQVVRQVVEEKQQEATRALAHRRRLLDEADRQLTELVGYRAEYAGGTVAQAATTGADLRDYWCFMNRLNRAIDDHRGRIDQQKIAVEQSLERWSDTKRELAVLDKVVERIRTADRRTQDRREQRLLDDMSGRRGPVSVYSDEVDPV